jgi:hypothetical protein
MSTFSVLITNHPVTREVESAAPQSFGKPQAMARKGRKRESLRDLR